jgi:hypothetical protein
LLVEFGSGDAKLIKELESEFVVVVETKYKGAGDSYKVFWFENGLKCLKVHLHQMKMMVHSHISKFRRLW